MTPATRDRSLHLPGFAVRTMYRPAGTVIPLHAHDTTNIALCVRGSFLETVGCRPVMMTPATLIARPAGELHENRFGSAPARYIVIELLPRATASFRSATDILERPFVRESPFIAAAARRMDAELRHEDDVTPLVIESLLHELVAHAHRAGVAQSPSAGRDRPVWLRQAVELLHEATEQGTPLGLGALAAQLGVHPSHLARTFRRELGCAVGEYLRTQRLERASRLLRAATRLPLAEVALAAGYADQSHFSNAFRRRFGVTPGQYRRAVRAS